MVINKALLSSNSDEWATPQQLFEVLDEYYHFELDPCATKENTKCAKFFTKADNGLIQDWGGVRAFCNPPYSNIAAWTERCIGEQCVLLIPARTDTRYWHNYIFPNATAIAFIKGRLKFGDAKNCAPFPSALILFNLIPIRSKAWALISSN